MPIKESELILNPDGSIYHLNLKPANIADTVIFVGDQDRVGRVTSHFETIEFETQKREFKTQTGFYKGKRISVISTGIGSDNIDIVLNELDALVNIDFETRQIKEKLKSLNIIRIGTSGSLQKDVPVNSFVLSKYAIDIDGMLQYYKTDSNSHPELQKAFVEQTNWSKNLALPTIVGCGEKLFKLFKNNKLYEGFTATAGGFYAPQGRILRLELMNPQLNSKMDTFVYNGIKITNLEMETSAIYGLAKLMGHEAISLNAIIANRASGSFSTNPIKVVDNLIVFALNKIVE